MEKARRILVAEDEPAAFAIVEMLLKREGFDVLYAPNGRAAVETALAQRPDAILMDVNMPEMDGHAACRILKADERTRDIPLLFLTGNDAPGDVVEGLRAGADDYVAKPPMNIVLLARIRAHLRLRDLHRRNVEYLEALQAARRDADVALLLGGVAHNFNNLLAPLSSTVESLATAVAMKDFEEVPDMANEIQAGLKRLGEFNRRVFAVRGKPDGESAVDAAATVRKVSDLLSCSLPSRIKLEVRLPESPAAIMVPPGRLDDAVLALLLNACEAIERGSGAGSVGIEIGRNPLPPAARARAASFPEDPPAAHAGAASSPEASPGVFVRIWDDGPGVPEELMGKIFLPFYSTKRTVGSGLGLSLAQRAIDCMHGTLTLRNLSPHGMEAQIVLPAAEASDA